LERKHDRKEEILNESNKERIDERHMKEKQKRRREYRA
jgi:hypothetical protein